MNVPDQYVGALRHSYARRVSVKPPAAAAVAKQVTSKVSAWRARLTAMRMPAGCASAVLPRSRCLCVHSLFTVPLSTTAVSAEC